MADDAFTRRLAHVQEPALEHDATGELTRGQEPARHGTANWPAENRWRRGRGARQIARRRGGDRRPAAKADNRRPQPQSIRPRSGPIRPPAECLRRSAGKPALPRRPPIARRHRRAAARCAHRADRRGRESARARHRRSFLAGGENRRTRGRAPISVPRRCGPARCSGIGPCENTSRSRSGHRRKTARAGWRRWRPIGRRRRAIEIRFPVLRQRSRG